MSLQINYTDPMGMEHPEAYARISVVKIDFTISIAKVGVNIFHTSATRSKSAEDQRKEPIQVINYYFDSKDNLFNTYFTDDTLKADGTSLLSSLYGWLKTHNDLASDRNAGGEHIINAGNGINWTTATDV